MHNTGSENWHLVEVVDELREVLDGVDVVVRGRGDEGHSRLAAPQVGDVRADLLGRQLAALTCHKSSSIFTSTQYGTPCTQTLLRDGRCQKTLLAYCP